MWFSVRDELARNFKAYTLIVLGVGLLLYGEPRHLAKALEVSGSFVSAAMIVFKGKTEQQ